VFTFLSDYVILRGYTSVNAENVGDFREFFKRKKNFIKYFKNIRACQAIFKLYSIIFLSKNIEK